MYISETENMQTVNEKKKRKKNSPSHLVATLHEFSFSH